MTGPGGSTVSIPQLVTQIADGENGGVMMNEFPPKYIEVIRGCSGSRTPIMNVTEYLEQILAGGLSPADLPAIQPIQQHRIWERMQPGAGSTQTNAQRSASLSTTIALP